MGAPGSIDAFEDACLSRCEINEIDIAPTYYEPGDNAIRRSWIEVTDGQSNVIGAPVEDALRCAIPQGIAGCGFESPLEAARLAILRSKEPGEPNHGFMRPDAHLAIVIVSDEVDCSIAPGMREAAIFEPDPDNDISPFPTSAVCWQAGVQCTGGPGTYDQCSSANIDENGVPTAVPALAVLEPVDTYTNFFAEIAAEKRLTTNASVMLFGVMGVPVGYPATPITYADATDPAFQTEFGIEPGCTHESGTAIPPVRVRDLMASLSDDGMSTGLRSICDPQLQDVFVSIFGDMAARMIQ